jgi:two-component sensor histidine kinase
LLSEVNHRVANSLTMVASMVGMQARASGNEETKRILADTQARINAVSVVHKQLYTSSNVQSVALPDFLQKLLDHRRFDAQRGAVRDGQQRDRVN